MTVHSEAAIARQPLRGSTADLVGIPRPDDPDWVARQQADVARQQADIAARPDPDPIWRPGDMAKGIWNRARFDWDALLCDPVTGDLLLDDDGRPIPAPGFDGEPVATEPRAWRTLADIPDDPPRPLHLGILEPDGPTLMYAAPGVGKGTSGAWIIVESQRLGMTPCVFDAERRPREWARRVSGLGGDRSRVVYVEPADLGRGYAGKPLWEATPALELILRAAGADLLLVDSVLPAAGVGEERLRSDAQAPFLYVSALDALGIPSVSFGHPPKGQPEGDPFGSMAWPAAMRLTWLGTRAEGDAHRVRWRPRKRNERGHVAGVLLTFDYAEDGRPCGVTREDDEESTREWLLVALVHGPRSVADMADELADESPDHVTADAKEKTKERLGKMLQRMARDGAVAKEGERGRGVKWSLKWAA